MGWQGSGWLETGWLETDTYKVLRCRCFSAGVTNSYGISIVRAPSTQYILIEYLTLCNEKSIYIEPKVRCEVWCNCLKFFWSRSQRQDHRYQHHISSYILIFVDCACHFRIPLRNGRELLFLVLIFRVPLRVASNINMTNDRQSIITTQTITHGIDDNIFIDFSASATYCNTFHGLSTKRETFKCISSEPVDLLVISRTRKLRLLVRRGVILSISSKSTHLPSSSQGPRSRA